MKMTTKGRYAVTALLDLALHDSKGSVNLADISKRQDISSTYLEQLFSKLKNVVWLPVRVDLAEVIDWHRHLKIFPLQKSYICS